MMICWRSHAPGCGSRSASRSLWTSYDLEFDRRALKEWYKLDATLRQQFKEKLDEVVHQPHVVANKLRELPSCYKIKLRAFGYRLIYQVIEQELVVLVIATGKRERTRVYQKASDRLSQNITKSP